MPWELIDENENLGPKAYYRKARLYADEDVEEEVVEFLRDEGVNIKSARELGHRGKPDGFHASLAYKEKRFLLTKNAKHFLDDRRLPMSHTYGVIAVQGDMGNLLSYAKAILNVRTYIIPYGEWLEKSKFVVSADQITVRFIAADGRMTTERFKVEGGKVYRWAPEQGGS